MLTLLFPSFIGEEISYFITSRSQIYQMSGAESIRTSTYFRNSLPCVETEHSPPIAETWTMTKEVQALLIFERKIFRIYSPKYEDGEWKSRTNCELEELSKGENIVKWIKGQRISWLGHLERMEENRMPQKYLHSRTGRDETKRKTQERMERRTGKRSSSVGSEKMERVGDR